MKYRLMTYMQNAPITTIRRRCQTSFYLTSTFGGKGSRVKVPYTPTPTLTNACACTFVAGNVHMQSHRTGCAPELARAQVARSRDSGWAERQRWIHLLQVRRYVHVVGIRALDWRRPASREGRDASQERTLILNRGPSCSERQSNERVFRGRITVVHPSGPDAPNRFRLTTVSRVCRVTSLRERDRGISWRREIAI